LFSLGFGASAKFKREFEEVEEVEEFMLSSPRRSRVRDDDSATFRGRRLRDLF